MDFTLAAALLALGTTRIASSSFTLGSTDIAEGQPIGTKHVADCFGCSGQNLSPALSWQGAPAGTRSYALMVHDPDAPTGSGWWHWVVWNIPASTTSLPTGAGNPAVKLMPAGAVQGNTDYGTPGYGGPCPPPGAQPHHYHFRLYALGVEKLELPANATAALVGFNVRANALAEAELMATYAR